MAKTVQEIEQVVIRFAGDSGDGMQVTGDRFTTATAVLGNDLATLPDFPAEIRAPAGSLAGVSGFQLHFADHDILTPGDAPNVLVAMNPAALKTNIGDLPKGGTLIVNEDAFEERNLAKAGYASNPLTDGIARRLRGLQDPAEQAHARRARGHHRPHAEGHAPLEEHVRARPAVVDVLASGRRQRGLDQRRSSARSPRSPRPTSARSAPASRSARRPRSSRRASSSSPRRSRPGRTATSPATRRITLGLVAASVRSGLPMLPRRLPDHAGVRHPARALAAQVVRHQDDAVRGRDRVGRRGARRVVRRRARRHGDVRAGPRSQVGDDRSRDLRRAAAARPRHPARRSVDGDADEDRAGRPPARDVRTSRRGAARRSSRRRRRPTASTSCIEAARIALKYRTPVIVLSDAFLATGSEPWQLPDVDSLPDLTHGVLVRDRAERRTTTSGRSCATRRRSRVRGRSRARPVSSTASAASRSRTARATSSTTRTTTTA